jgi:MFS family permease
MGLGIGLTFPVLSAAAVSSLPPEQLAVGSAVNQTARQVGGAIGIAILVVLVGSQAAPAEAVAQFHHLWAYCAAMALGSGLAGTRLRRPPASRPQLVAEPVRR